MFYRSFAEAISDLDEKDQLAAFWNIVRYGLDGDEPTERGAASAVFRMAKPQIDANYSRYKNGIKGGRPINNQTKPDNNQIKPSCNQIKPNDNQTEPNCDFAKPNVNENENVNVKDKKDIVGQAATKYPYKAVIDYLNDKAGTAFKDQSKDSRKHIKARFDDGFCLDDFFRVIDNKVAEWGGTEMAPYLRPSTLFGTKFEAYLNQKSGGARASGGAKNSGSGNKFHNFPQRDYDCDKLVEELNGF